ncbi:DeoR/GlpR family DNA-binding transcription regulator [Kiloniella laminariae]|uniref:DeoR/GlpR family DNA-binding transcription regulator n=1 Tax=Kiloniella laminariae TaxID=454162 RepID=UPI00146B650C|nr:DeoR/GlpR family DNA-binding transcription regulator [Kiloniella laminariae]
MTLRLSERQYQILEWTGREDALSIDDLAQHFQLSTQTIRKDINALCEIGMLRRVHGGVCLPSAIENLSFSTRQVMNARNKEGIAALAARQIPEGSTIFLGIGTSVGYVAKALLKHNDLRVLTNNLQVAAILCKKPKIDTHVSGGKLRHSDHDLVGVETIRFFDAFKADFAIVGTGGLDPAFGMMDFKPDEAHVTQAILENSRRKFLVADHSKWNRAANVKVTPFQNLDLMVTDYLPETLCSSSETNQLFASKLKVLECRSDEQPPSFRL